LKVNTAPAFGFQKRGRAVWVHLCYSQFCHSSARCLPVAGRESNKVFRFVNLKSMFAKRGLSPLVIVLILAVLAGAGYWAYHAYQKKFVVNYDNNASPPSAEALQSVAETVGWKTYRNEKYGFAFKYPETWQLVQSEEVSIGVHEKVSFSLKTPKPNETWIPFSVVVYKKNEWPQIKADLQRSRRSFQELRSDDNRVLISLLPYPYSIPSGFGFETTYNSILATFTFAE